jgi:hypothetical protein
MPKPPPTPDQLRRRKRVQARLTTTGALIGLGALGARGGGAIAARRGASGVRLAHRLDSATTNALTIGAGVGGVAGLNSASISRAEGRVRKNLDPKEHTVSKSAFGVEHQVSKALKPLGGQPAKVLRAMGKPGEAVHTEIAALRQQKYGSRPRRAFTRAKRVFGKSAFGVDHEEADPERALVKAADPLVRQYGLRGSPTGVDRGKRQEIWEARSKHLNRKRDRWNRTSKTARVVEGGAGVTAGVIGAAAAGSQVRDAMGRENPAAWHRFAHGVGRTAYRAHKAGVPARHAQGAMRAVVHGRPGYKMLAVGGGAAVASAGARQVRIAADKRKRKYASASGGIASGTARRMRDYSVGKSAFGVEAPIGKADTLFHGEPREKRTFDHKAISQGAAAMGERVKRTGPRLARPKGSAYRSRGSFDAEHSRRRRADAYTGAAAGGAVLAGARARTAYRTGRGQQRQAAQHFAASNTHFREANVRGGEVASRLARHAQSVSPGSKVGGLPPTGANLGETFSRHQKQNESLGHALGAQGRHAEAAAHAARSLRRAGRYGLAAAGLAGSAAALQRHQRRGGASYSYR